MTIGQRINKARIERDLTIDQLSERANVSKNTLAEWIYRDGHPRINPLIRVADTLEMSLDELVGRNVPPEKAAGSEVAEAARSIFEEIEKIFSASETPMGAISCLACLEYAELKRKYEVSAE